MISYFWFWYAASTNFEIKWKKNNVNKIFIKLKKMSLKLSNSPQSWMLNFCKNIVENFSFLQMNIPVSVPSKMRPTMSDSITSVAKSSTENLSSSSPSLTNSCLATQNSEEGKFNKRVTFSKSQSLEETR